MAPGESVGDLVAEGVELLVAACAERVLECPLPDRVEDLVAAVATPAVTYHRPVAQFGEHGLEVGDVRCLVGSYVGDDPTRLAVARDSLGVG